MDRENAANNTERREESAVVNKGIDPNRTTSKVKALSAMAQQSFLSVFYVF